MKGSQKSEWESQSLDVAVRGRVPSAGHERPVVACPAVRIRRDGVGSVVAGPVANLPGLGAAVRRRAAPRVEATHAEANGIDCGASPDRLHRRPLSRDEAAFECPIGLVRVDVLSSFENPLIDAPEFRPRASV